MPPAESQQHGGQQLNPAAYGGLSLFVVGVGFVGALQAALNTRASEHLGLWLLGTAVSFFSGWAVLCVALAVHAVWSARSARPLATCACLRWRARPAPHQLLPGVLGALFVTSSVAIPPVLGYALYYVLTTAGFLSMSAAIDHLSLWGNARRPISAQRVGALALALAGAVLAVLDRLRSLGGTRVSGGGAAPGVVAACVVLALAAGFLLPAQASINRQAAERLPTKLSASWWSFTCGCTAIAVALAAQLGAQPGVAAGVPAAFATTDVLHYLGGPCGVLTICSGIVLVRPLGSAQYFVCMVCGQLAGSLAVDATGILGARVVPATPSRGAGVALVLVASLAMQLKCGGAGGGGWTRAT